MSPIIVDGDTKAPDAILLVLIVVLGLGLAWIFSWRLVTYMLSLRAATENAPRSTVLAAVIRARAQSIASHGCIHSITVVIAPGNIFY
ncbi:MAG TPA: hypothetical protein VGO57_14380 [Verrucomicrobiae bacterium]